MMVSSFFLRMVTCIACYYTTMVSLVCSRSKLLHVLNVFFFFAQIFSGNRGDVVGKVNLSIDDG